MQEENEHQIPLALNIRLEYSVQINKIPMEMEKNEQKTNKMKKA